MIPIASTQKERNQFIADRALSHLARPAQHKTVDGRELPPLLSSDEMTMWATEGEQPALWDILGVSIKRPEWDAKRKRMTKQQRISNAMADLIRDGEPEEEESFSSINRRYG